MVFFSHQGIMGYLLDLCKYNHHTSMTLNIMQNSWQLYWKIVRFVGKKKQKAEIEWKCRSFCRNRELASLYFFLVEYYIRILYLNIVSAFSQFVKDFFTKCKDLQWGACRTLKDWKSTWKKKKKKKKGGRNWMIIQEFLQKQEAGISVLLFGGTLHLYIILRYHFSIPSILQGLFHKM